MTLQLDLPRDDFGPAKAGSFSSSIACRVASPGIAAFVCEDVLIAVPVDVARADQALEHVKQLDGTFHAGLASGGSFAIRRLYTDEDEVLSARPAILNGIEDVITRLTAWAATGTV